MSEKEKVYSVKIILLGETGVGKTCLINVYLDENEFNPLEITTVVSTQNFKSLELNNKKLNISFWNFNRQKKFLSFIKSFIKGSNIVIFAYDITNKLI